MINNRYHAHAGTTVPHALVTMVMLQLCLPMVNRAQEVIQPPSGLRIVSSDNTARPNASVATQTISHPHAVAVSAQGKCDCSDDGITFSNVESGHILEQGSIVRTGEAGWTDLCFWHSGVTLRVQGGTEIRVEKLVINLTDGHLVLRGLLELRKGKIFLAVHSASAESALEILNAAGRTEVEGSRAGNYIIAADGTQVSDKNSTVPLKLNGENGVTLIAAGEQFTRKDGKTPLTPSTLSANDLTQLDELHAAVEKPVLKTSSLKP